MQSGRVEGYNLFSQLRTKSQSGMELLPEDTRRERRFGFSISGPSVFDGGMSAKLDYGGGNGNGLLFGGMRDEVRMALHGAIDRIVQ